LTVYNVLGQEVETLVDGMHDAGYAWAEWSGRDANGLSLPTGIYFVRMSARSTTGARSESFNQTLKIMLMK
ncbi:MAG TPA: FlgD immunoglobulin-like domain containing protein, partial [Bacteroidota bacterium]|nr:FlgD immunoglobulin-like domain containing protein [Bacteroidota bacterium]